jgi:hypothetical protein
LVQHTAKSGGLIVDDKNRIYRFWNGKNIDGNSTAGEPDLLDKIAGENQDSLLKYEVGVDTFSADDLQTEDLPKEEEEVEEEEE